MNTIPDCEFFIEHYQRRMMGKQVSFWRRELKRARKKYVDIKASRFHAMYAGVPSNMSAALDRGSVSGRWSSKHPNLIELHKRGETHVVKHSQLMAQMNLADIEMRMLAHELTEAGFKRGEGADHDCWYAPAGSNAEVVVRGDDCLGFDIETRGLL